MCLLCILSAVFQLRALLYVLCAFVILNKHYLLTYRQTTGVPDKYQLALIDPREGIVV